MNTSNISILNIKRVALIVAVAGLLLSALLLPVHIAQAQAATNATSSDQFVSPELVEQLEALQALVEELVLLVEQTTNQQSNDVGSTVSSGAQSLGENIVRVFVGDDLTSIRYRQTIEEAREVCQDAVNLTPLDEGYGTQNNVLCTWNGETIHSGVTQSVDSGSSAFDSSGR